MKQSIGAQEMERKGISDVEEGLTKVTGITKAESKGLFVRGLENRYNNLLINDLQAAACSLRPALRLVLDVGNDYGALGGVISGSGPTVAFLVSDDEHAMDLTVALSGSGVVSSVVRATGAVAGARIVESF